MCNSSALLHISAIGQHGELQSWRCHCYAGAIGELAKDAPACLVGTADALARVIIRELRSKESTNRRNAAFACGTLLSGLPQEFGTSLEPLLQVH